VLFVFYALHDPQEGSLSGTIALGGERHLRSMDRLDGWDLPDLVTISNGDRPIGLLHRDGLGSLRVVLAPGPPTRIAGLTLLEPAVDRRFAEPDLVGVSGLRNCASHH
jgi:hypothetical protein